MSERQFSVGIDLGTTHSVISYSMLDDEDQTVETLAIPQLTALGQVEEKPQLPSFIYQYHDAEVSDTDLHLPWSTESKYLTGSLARTMGAKTPIRLIASAKSWLCHGGVNRREAFLPQGSPEEVAKVSPFDASFAYLEHIKSAWENEFPDAPLADQDVTLTVPASFDPAARDLTAEAARRLGIQHLTLLEEPQAAVYSWIKNQEETWRDQVTVGDTILVIDVGGGTTDLSLVAVTEEEGNLTLNRIAVGDHILLGGDNMDLALAYQLKMKLAQQGKQLQPWQIQAMTQACRDAKETLLADNDVQSVPIVVPSRGSKLIGGTLQTELTREEVTTSLVEGFFPQTPVDVHPKELRRGALTQMGLPYAQDAAVTRHIAGFLCRQANAIETEQNEAFIKPTAILLNGGVLKSNLLAERLVSTINTWLTQAGHQEAKRLSGIDLDLAVSSGAAYFGNVRQGKGVRIRGGIASSYYVGIESAMPAIPGMAPPMEALCVAPFGMEEGAYIEVPSQEFGLVIGEPVHFQFYGSTSRREDLEGTHLDFWQPEELEELPEIQVTLPLSEGRNQGDVVPVKLASYVSEIGTLRLEAIALDNDQKWQVEFDVREA